MESINSKNLTMNEYEFDEIATLNNHTHNEHLLILHVNIRSVNCNINELETLLHTMVKKPDIIICSEAWLQKLIGSVPLNGYNFYTNNSIINQNDGVVTYVSKNLNENTNIETYGKLKTTNTVINLKNNKKIVVTGLYRCFKYNQKEFIADLKLLIDKNKHLKNHIIIGDTNIDTISNNNLTSNEYLNTIYEKSYLPRITSITHPNKENLNIGTCIDHIITKLDFGSESAKICYKLTDHYPVTISINTENNLESFLKEKSCKTNIKKLKKSSQTTDWNPIYNTNDVNKSTGLLLNNIKELIANSTSNIKQNRKTDPRKEWITKGLAISCNKKQKLFKEWKKDPLNESNTIKYKTYTHILSKLLRNAKINFEKAKAKDFDSKKLWKYVNEKLNKKNNKRKTNIDHLIENDIKITDEDKIANTFNKFFSTIGLKLADKIKEATAVETKYKNKYSSKTKPPVNSIFFEPVSKIEVIKIINSLKNKNGGIDKIHANILKEIAEEISGPLTHIINISLFTGICPEHFKIAEVVPIHKAGEKYKTTNYRPISLISNIAKIFEKVLHVKLSKYFIKNKILSEKQFGFVNNKGTKDALATITDIIYNKLDNSEPVIAIMLDLAKAFDTVNHKLLFDKLERLGIRGTPLNLIKSYLTDRKQFVRLNNCNSIKEKVTIGVPQGTILGPLFFIIYINDMLDLIPNIFSYADDTIILCSKKTWAETQLEAQKNLNIVYNWLQYNVLSLNVEKTVYMTFSTYIDKFPSNFELNINNKQLLRVSSHKYLGLQFDQHMKWDIQLNKTVKKLRYLISVFYKLKNILRRSALISIYYGLFNSVATYGIIAWGNTTNSSIKNLINLQRRVWKIIFGNGTDIVNPPLSITQSYCLEALHTHYIEMTTFFTNSKQGTRNRGLKPPTNNLEIGKRDYKYTAIKYFNKLPLELREQKFYTNAAIRNRLKNWFKKYTSHDGTIKT